MNSKTLTKVHKFGKIGNIVAIVLIAALLIMAVLTVVGAVYVASLPKDAVTAAVTNSAELRINSDRFDTIWNIINDSVGFATNQDLGEIMENGVLTANLPENQELQIDLDVFGTEYSQAVIKTENGSKIINAKTVPNEYRSGDLVPVIVSYTLMLLSAAAALVMLKKLFKVLSVCESPFSTELVKNMKCFGFSLIPIAVFSSIAETLSQGFLSAGENEGVYIQWGVILAFAVTMCLVTVFKYGVQLQQESDETL